LTPLKIIITGRPGIGKTTIFNKVVENIKRYVIVGGIVCPEVREGHSRIGFKIRDLLSGREDWLAHKYLFKHGPRIGKYTVNIRAGIFGARALEKAIKEADVIGIDEIGPMELKLEELRSAIIRVLESNKPVIAVVHYRMHDPVILSLLNDAEKYIVTVENREFLADKIISKFLALISGKD